MLAALLFVLGLLGILYSSLVWHGMVRSGISASLDREDRVCYALFPAIAYAALLAAGASLFFDRASGLAVLAAAVAVLLFIGIRNAWDMTTWILAHRGQ